MKFMIGCVAALTLPCSPLQAQANQPSLASEELEYGGPRRAEIDKSLAAILRTAKSQYEAGDFDAAEASVLESVVHASTRNVTTQGYNLSSNLMVTELQITARDLGKAGLYKRGEFLWSSLVEIRASILGREHADSIRIVAHFSDYLLAFNRNKEALSVSNAALSFAEENVAKGNVFGVSLVPLLLTRSRALNSLNFHDEALASADRALSELRDFGINPKGLLRADINLVRGQALVGVGSLIEGKKELVRAYLWNNGVLGHQNSRTIGIVQDYGRALIINGEIEKAQEVLQVALKNELASGRRGESLSNSRYLLASALLSKGNSANEAFSLANDNLIFMRQQERNGVRRSLGDTVNSWQRKSRTGKYRQFADAAWSAEAKDNGRRGHQSGGDNDDTLDISAEAFWALQSSISGSTTRAVALSAAQKYALSVGSKLKSLADERVMLERRWNDSDEEIASQMTRESLGGETKSSFGQDRRLLLQAIDQIDREIISFAPAYLDIRRSLPLSLTAAQSLVSSTEAVLLLVPSEFGTHAMVVTQDSLKWHRSDMTEAQIGEAVGTLRSSLDQLPGTDGTFAASFDRSLAHKLYLELIAPLEDALEGKDHVFVAAGGALTSLPMAVLVSETPVGDDGDPQALRDSAWLDKRFALVQIPSLQSLQFLRQMAQDDGTASSQPFVGFGDPVLEGQFKPGQRMSSRSGSYSQVAGSPVGEDGIILADVERLRALPKLPGTLGELNELARALLPRSERTAAIRTGKAASETGVKNADLSGTRVLAFATHGLLAGEEGAAEPGLVFTPPAEATIEDDGLLTASEITALDLNAEWVILSACNTAGGDEPGAPGLSGLARAFFYAGAKSLLASHWPVLDEVAPRITVQTLRPTQGEGSDRTQVTGLTRAQAFARAVDMVRNDTAKPAYAHPAAWAPFVLVGDK